MHPESKEHPVPQHTVSILRVDRGNLVGCAVGAVDNCFIATSQTLQNSMASQSGCGHGSCDHSHHHGHEHGDGDEADFNEILEESHPCCQKDAAAKARCAPALYIRQSRNLCFENITGSMEWALGYYIDYYCWCNVVTTPVILLVSTRKYIERGNTRNNEHYNPTRW